MNRRTTLSLFGILLLGAAGLVRSETFFSETATEMIKIEVVDGVEVDRWRYPKDSEGPPKLGQAFVNSLGMKLVWVPNGRFLRGTSTQAPGRARGEGPVRQVTFERGFWVASHELTQSQYEDLGFLHSSRFSGPDRPLERVSWEQAMIAIQALNERESRAGRLPRGWAYSLPTETQWEYFARAGFGGQTWAGPLRTKSECSSPTLDPIAWYCGNSGTSNADDHDTSRWGPRRGASRGFIGTHPVGRKRPNPWGIYDVYGNVAEWCLDMYFPDYSSAADDGSAQGAPEVPGRRVVRGGSWNSTPSECRAARRRNLPQDIRNARVGFRVVLVPQ